MIKIIKGIIFGGKKIEEEKIPHAPSLLITNPTQDPNHQREILRRQAQLSKKNKN